MVFKTVDGHITNIFNKVDKLNTGFELTNDEIQGIVNRFNELNSTQNFGQEYTDFITEMTERNFNVSQMFDSLAKQGASAKASVKDFYATILDGNTKGFANVKSTMTLFNQAQQSGADNAKAFAKAVGQSNTQLGNYLGGLNGAKASLVGYGTQLAITTAKTIGLRAVTMALNTALSFGVLTVVSLFVSKLDEWIVTQKELTEQTKESADKAKEQAAAFSDLKTQYLAIIDSADDEATKTEKLNEWKNTLIETYGFEKKALESLNTEREKGIELLEQESKAGIKSTYQNYLVENKNEIEKAKKKLGQLGEFNIFTGSQIDVDENADFGVAKNLQKYFDVKSGDYLGELNYKLSINFDDAVDELDQLTKIQDEINNIESERKVMGKGLTEDEKIIRQYVESEISRIEKLNDKYLSTYQSSAEAGAWVKFNTDANQKALEAAGKDGYSSWRNAFLKQAESPAEQREMEKILAENVPDLETAYKTLETRRNNLELAKSKFGISDLLNSESARMKAVFVNSLDDTDLDILVNKIEDPFKNGIEGAKKAIEDFKADPKNQINVETDTSSLEEATKKLEDYSKSISDYTKAQKTITDAYNEQTKYGQLAADTIQSLIDAGYAEALVVNDETGAVTLNTSAVEMLNNQKKVSLLLDAQKQKSELTKQLDDEKSKIDSLTSSLMTNNEKKKKSYVADLLAAQANKEQIESQIAMYDALISSLDAPDFGTKNKEDPATVKQFKKDNKEKKHLLEMEQISAQEYYDWLDSESQRVYGKLTDYQDELWKHEEEVYKWRQEQEQELFDKKIDNLEKLADKALDNYKDGDGNELTVTASFDYAREQINKAITETQARIDGIRSGTISGNTDDIKALIDDLDSLNDKLIDINKKEIESEKDYISELKDDYSDMMDERIDKVDELSDKIEKSYDKQIDAIDKQIDELEKVKDTEDRIKKIKDAQLAVKEKEQALDEAKREDAKNNYVYFDGTGMSVQTSNENQKKAQEELDESKKDLEEAYRDEQISVLKDQKDILEEQKDTAKDYYDNVKDNLEKQKTQGEKTYEAVEKIYEQLGGDKKQTSSNVELVKKLSKSGDISKAMSELSDTERQKVIDTGVVKVQPNGDYTFDYSAFEKYSSTVDDNTLATQDLTSVLKDIVTQADTNNKNKTDNSMVAGGFNLVADPKTGKLTKKQVMVNGEVVEGLGHKVNATSKEEWQEHNNSEKTSKGSFAGYDTFIDFMRAVRAGKVDISPITNAFNSNYNPIVDKMNKSMSDTINNVSNSNVNNVNNKPVVNLTVNVEGSADKKTVEAFRDVASREIANAFNYLNQKLDNTKI